MHQNRIVFDGLKAMRKRNKEPETLCTYRFDDS